MASSMTPRRNATTRPPRRRRGPAPSSGSTNTRASQQGPESKHNRPSHVWEGRVRFSVLPLPARRRRESAAPCVLHSLRGGQPNDDENRIVLLAAVVHG